MSNAEDILQVIARGETSRMQMKERITDKYEVACELVAFSNSKGGRLIVGVNDKTCSINALSYSETQETVGLLGNMATENVLPGILPGGLSVDDILTGISMPRNETLFAHAIYLLPYTGVGSGIRRALAENVDIKFVNNERTNEFVIMINITKSADKVTKSDAEVINPHNQVADSGTDLDTDLDTNLDTQCQKTGKSSPTLTKKQKDILNFCTVPRTSKAILERMGLSNHSANRERHIKPLVMAGLLEMTNPDNPNASNQKYRKAKKKTEEERG